AGRRPCRRPMPPGDSPTTSWYLTRRPQLWSCCEAAPGWAWLACGEPGHHRGAVTAVQPPPPSRMSLSGRPDSAGERARQSSRDAHDAVHAQSEGDDTRIVQVPIRIGNVIAGLERQAIKGNANAARELRAWLAEYPPEDATIDPEQLDRRTRQRMLAR